MSKPDDSDTHKEADEIDNEDKEEDCIETTIERVQHDQEELRMEERDQEEQEEENESSENGIDEEVKEGNKKKIIGLRKSNLLWITSEKLALPWC